MENAKKLPASGGKEDCPPCNPGMHSNGTGAANCAYCPVDHFSDGKAGMICRKLKIIDLIRVQILETCVIRNVWDQ